MNLILDRIHPSSGSQCVPRCPDQIIAQELIHYLHCYYIEAVCPRRRSSCFSIQRLLVEFPELTPWEVVSASVMGETGCKGFG